jgi:hypothetical protein
MAVFWILDVWSLVFRTVLPPMLRNGRTHLMAPNLFLMDYPEIFVDLYTHYEIEYFYVSISNISF